MGGGENLFHLGWDLVGGIELDWGIEAFMIWWEPSFIMQSFFEGGCSFDGSWSGTVFVAFDAAEVDSEVSFVVSALNSTDGDVDVELESAIAGMIVGDDGFSEMKLSKVNTLFFWTNPPNPKEFDGTELEIELDGKDGAADRDGRAESVTPNKLPGGLLKALEFWKEFASVMSRTVVDGFRMQLEHKLKGRKLEERFKLGLITIANSETYHFRED